MKRSLLLFRNDLCTHDNEALKLAAEYDELIPVYCFEPRHLQSQVSLNKKSPASSGLSKKYFKQVPLCGSCFPMGNLGSEYIQEGR